MPEYIVTHKETGRKFKITGSRAPTQQEAREYMQRAIDQSAQEEQPKQQQIPLGTPQYAVLPSAYERQPSQAAIAVSKEPREFARGLLQGGFLASGVAQQALQRGTYGAPAYGYAQEQTTPLEEPKSAEGQISRNVGRGASTGLQALAIGGGTAGLRGLGGVVAGSLASTSPYAAEMAAQERPVGDIAKEAGIGLLIDLGLQALIKVPGFVPAIRRRGEMPLRTAVVEAAQEIGQTIPEEVVKNIPEDVTAVKMEALEPHQFEKLRGKTAVTAAGEQIEIPEAKAPFLKDISEGEYNYLATPKAEGTVSLKKYLKQMEEKDFAGPNPNIKTPYQVAANNATKAFDDVDNLRKQAGTAIDQSLNNAKNTRVDIFDIKDKYMNLVKERIGDIDSGIVTSAAEAADAKAMEDYLVDIFPSNPTVKEAHQLKRYIRDGVTYNKEGAYKPTTSTLQGIMKEISDDIATRIGDAAPGYAEANKEYSKYIEIENLLSKALKKKVGGISSGGASMMKRGLESLADSGIAEIFDMVKNVTGGKYDLMQDALYASIAQRLSKEPRYREQASRFGKILQMGGVQGDAANVAIKGVEAARRKGASKRLAQWYEKAQKAYENKSGVQDVIDKLKSERGSVGTSINPQVNTENFKKWFGDSKVVDEAGEPLIVYHGMPLENYATKEAKKFNVFDRNRLGGETYGNAADKAYAATSLVGFWHNDKSMLNRARSPYHTELKNYISIENPIEYNSLEDLATEMYDIIGHRETRESARRKVNKWIEEKKKEGFDGVVINDEEFGGKSYAPFDNTQIKSATGNTGEFNNLNPDIRGNVGGTEIMGGIAGLGMLGTGLYRSLQNRKK